MSELKSVPFDKEPIVGKCAFNTAFVVGGRFPPVFFPVIFFLSALTSCSSPVFQSSSGQNWFRRGTGVEGASRSGNYA